MAALNLVKADYLPAPCLSFSSLPFFGSRISVRSISSAQSRVPLRRVRRPFGSLLEERCATGTGFRVGTSQVFRNSKSPLQQHRPSARPVMARAGSSGATQTGPLGFPWLVHLLNLAVPACFAATFFNGSRFGYHPPLLAAGFLFFMGEGIMVAIGAKGKSRQILLKLHALLQALAAGAIFAGMYAIYTNKTLNNKLHFTSLHGRVGLATLICAALVSLNGIPTMYGVPSALKSLRPNINKAHKLVGATAFLSAGVTIVLGLQTFNPAHPLHKGPITYALAASTLVCLASVLHSSFLATQTKKALQQKGSAVTQKVE
eukprot:TRINITY_DN38727_c0_g1_i1.p1 TRINITY_DN38727_c0_g1~~TRINITY_DN38727_c0_g1_i1.p1  ORF type:complete len:317 (-),score=36.56 TRINITY_DN38727_c0_g1_i1:283-1233(-)